MARYKKLATVLKKVDYKKSYKPTKKNTVMMFNILNHSIFSGKLEMPNIRIRKLRGALVSIVMIQRTQTFLKYHLPHDTIICNIL